PEKQVIVMDEMGYDDHEVAATGLARFDNLVQVNPPKDILLMPTWRDWINTDEQFLKSEYFLAYSNLIQNEKLLQLLEECNVNINFYPHYRAQDYFQSEIENMHERIKFIPLGSQTVQQLLIDHALLITDYSSVRDRKSTRLNSSHVKISYAVFCLKKKKIKKNYLLCLSSPSLVFYTRLRSVLPPSSPGYELLSTDKYSLFPSSFPHYPWK